MSLLYNVALKKAKFAHFCYVLYTTTSMKKLYIVRHAESTSNAARIHQDSSIPLSKTGIVQARRLGKRLSTIPIDCVLVSPAIRAQQTADIINQYIKKPHSTEKLLNERQAPTILVGRSFDDPLRREYENHRRKHASDPHYRYDDTEENFYDLKRRIHTFITTIQGHKADNILAVTHSVVLRMIVGLVLFEESFTPHLFHKFIDNFKSSNTGITLIENRSNNKLRLLTFNDFAHLG